MRWLQHLLTIVLAISLTSSVPGAALSCVTQQMNCASAPDEVDSCCTPSTCRCQLSVPGAQQSRPDSAIVVNPVNSAPAKSLSAVGIAVSADLSKSPTAEVAPSAETTRSLQLPLYTLNHAFLI
jgi:hypothetical protein